MTNATKAKKQRAKGSRKPPARRGRSSQTGLWLGLGALVVGLVVVAVVATGDTDTANEPAPAGSVEIAREGGGPLAPGEAVPDWSAPSLDGAGTIAWSDHVGSPTVLAIWAPWCPHCQAELPRLSAALARYPGIGLVTISTAVAQGSVSSQGYLDREGLTFPVAVDDSDGTLAQGLGVQGFPQTYFVDPEGRVVNVTSGELSEEELSRLLTDLQGR
jgi:peroxiredoxin